LQGIHPLQHRHENLTTGIIKTRQLKINTNRTMRIDFTNNKNILQNYYDKQGISEKFDEDCLYLEKSFNEISKMWLENLNKIDKVNFIMIAEAPLWGKVKKYIYNPEINNSQFFYRSDLGDILNKTIADKKSFINECNDIGLIVVDISPFALNPTDTSINYRKMTTEQYRELVNLTIPHFLELKIRAIKEKKSKNVKTFFRYARVKNNFHDLISNVLIDYGIIGYQNQIGDISQKGGGIDKSKLKHIILSK